MTVVQCPDCARQLEVEDQYRDWTVRCPHCGHEFVPNDVREREARAKDRPRPRARRRREEDNDRDDRDRDEVPEDVRQEALQLVAAPSICLELCGWLTALAALGVSIALSVVVAEMVNNPQPNDDPELFLLFGCVAFLLIPYGVAIAVGARKMRNLSSYDWAKVAGILGAAPFLVVGVCAALHAGLAAWALLALEKPVVRVAFGLPARGKRRRRPRQPDWD